MELSKTSYNNETINNAKTFKSTESNKYSSIMNYNSNMEITTLPDKKKDKKQKKFIRVSGGQSWEDPTLAEWDDGKLWLIKNVQYLTE